MPPLCKKTKSCLISTTVSMMLNKPSVNKLLPQNFATMWENDLKFCVRIFRDNYILGKIYLVKNIFQLIIFGLYVENRTPKVGCFQKLAVQILLA